MNLSDPDYSNEQRPPMALHEAIKQVLQAKMERLPERLDGLHLLLLNAGELATVAADKPAALAALHGRGVAGVLVSLGAEGLLYSEPGRAPRHWPAPEVPVVDVTGAGDTVIGTLALALSAGASMKNGAILANYAAGIVVGMVGTATVTPKQLSEALEHD